jgi:hypothetical protein
LGFRLARARCRGSTAEGNDLGIGIRPVPKGLTGEYQQLDRCGFRPLKRIGQSLWDARAAREPRLHWNHLESAKLLEVAWAQLPRRALACAWRFEEEEFGLFRKQCNDQLAADRLYLEDSDWEEQESPVDDPACGTEDCMRDKPDASDDDESEPGSTDTWNGRYRLLKYFIIEVL